MCRAGRGAGSAEPPCAVAEEAAALGTVGFEAGARLSSSGGTEPSPGTMPSYTVTVATGSQWFAGTDDYVYLTLQGTDGCSDRHLLDKPFYNDFERGAVSPVRSVRSAQHPRPRGCARRARFELLSPFAGAPERDTETELPAPSPSPASASLPQESAPAVRSQTLAKILKESSVLTFRSPRTFFTNTKETCEF